VLVCQDVPALGGWGATLRRLRRQCECEQCDGSPAAYKCFLLFEKVITELWSSRICIALLALSVIALSGNPGREDRHGVRFERHQIGAISAG
jgi:hypothetical protein